MLQLACNWGLAWLPLLGLAVVPSRWQGWELLWRRSVHVCAVNRLCRVPTCELPRILAPALSAGPPCPPLGPPQTLQEPLVQCQKGWGTSSWVTGSTAGSRCSSSRYSSSFDCPSRCTWNSSRLADGTGGQCAGLPPPPAPAGAPRGRNATCLLHPPCSAASSADPAAPDGPCYCCELEVGPSPAAVAAGWDFPATCCLRRLCMVALSNF